MNSFSDQKIIDSWNKNVDPWINAIRNQEIESRKIATDRAIISTMINEHPKSILDIGCGEGWLIRELTDMGIECTGIDVVPEFIQYAQNQNKGRFVQLAYEDLNATVLGNTFDAIVCNFSLIGKESVEHIFATAPKLLNRRGSLVIQTLHPDSFNNEQKLNDGWQSGSWKGFSKNFIDPAPWFFRTMESWLKLYTSNGFDIPIFKPINHPEKDEILSMILIGHRLPS